ncbi:MAG: HAMP domain-containing histidine kinase [Clostridia bacterium]|nr:HAMP domain-containing histidine kinase [Clostridia bacterium]
MKHWYRTLTAKIICFILCILSLIMTVASAFGIIVLISTDVYTCTQQDITNDVNYELIYNRVYDIFYRLLANDGYSPVYFNQDYSSDNTNLRFRIKTIDGEAVYDNGYEEKSENRVYVFYCNVNKYDNGETDLDIIPGHRMESCEYQLEIYVDGGFSVYDRFAFADDVINIGYALRYWIYAITFISFILCVTFFILLMCASGRRPASDKVHTGMMTFVPIDILITMSAFIALFGFHLIFDVFYTGEAAMVAMAIVWSVVCVNMVLGLCMSIACRIKQRTIFSDTFIWWILKFIYGILKAVGLGTGKLFKAVFRLIRRIPLVWKTALAVAVNFFIDMLLIFLALDWYWYAEMYMIFFAIKSIVIGAGVIYIALSMRALQKGGEAIAKGDVSYRVDTSRMLWDFKRHGENLNSISDGVSLALEQRLTSERTKTELITNVSHDIKTPLTSIINYSNLISRERDTAKCKEYSAVLVRKSEHLKRLLDDLVEISKATTGNLEVSLTPCDGTVLLGQVAGEFEERCRNAELELITSMPDSPVRIMADSRRIWRVFENLMTNACKYSLTGSRVYLTLTREENEACFIFRNTSRTALNISADELMERFVRGDSSRSTEGNGLGLSIARSLTELQNGKMDIIIDGDLFKVTLRFPLI